MSENKPYEYRSEELEVGMEVAVAYTNRFLHRHTRWEKHTITKLTPKKTKATLDDGSVVTANKSYFGYESKLYKHEPWMDEETRLHTLDKESGDVLLDINNIYVSGFVMSIPDVEMEKVHGLLMELKKYIDPYKEKKRRWQ